MIYTGYFAKTKKYLEAGLVPISIASKAPFFYKGLKYTKLAPSYELLFKWKNGEIDSSEYIKIFNKQILSLLNQSDIKNELYELSGGANVILLCYEKPSDFCHRHLVADWFNKSNIPVSEY